MDPDPVRKAQKHAFPVDPDTVPDPDPQHWLKQGITNLQHGLKKEEILTTRRINIR
jgi:hypothetical protein